MTRIRSVKIIDGFLVRLGLTNGQEKSVNLEPFFHGPIFEQIKKNKKLFQTIHVDEELGTIVWDNGADIDPDVLIEDLTPAWMEDEPASLEFALHEHLPRYNKINKSK